MNRTLRIIGIVLMAAGILSLLMAMFWNWAYRGLMDAPAEKYARLRQNMRISLIAGAVLTVLGAAGLIYRRTLL